VVAGKGGVFLFENLSSEHEKSSESR
jgi:hypothetical protein